MEQASLTYIIRDHDSKMFQAKKERMERIAQWLNELWRGVQVWSWRTVVQYA